jgi:56kDa selenium binding protein (SBP56)
MATTLRPDQTLYPSPRLASEAPAETLAYTVTYDPTARRPDALVTIDVDPGSPRYREVVGRLEMPNLGDELHHFGWNVCSSALCPYAPHPHTERRYLVVPGLRSSRIYVIDTRPDPRSPRLVKTIEAKEIARRTGYSRRMEPISGLLAGSVRYRPELPVPGSFRKSQLKTCCIGSRMPTRFGACCAITARYASASSP